MKTFTHQQAQEILQSGQEAAEMDREALAQHLAICAECRAYAALVNELAQDVPVMYSTAALSERDIRLKVLDNHQRFRRQFIMTHITQGARSVVTIGAVLALLLVLVILSPRLLPDQTGTVVNPTAAPRASTDLAPTPEPTESSPTNAGSLQYTVEEGDTLIGIADKFNLKPQTVLWTNTDVLFDDPHKLQPGIILRIPSVDGLYYRWEAGDTIETVAERFGAEPQAIRDWPENAGPFEPRVEIFIPGGKMPLQPAPAITPQPYTEDDPNRDRSCTWQEVPLAMLPSSLDSNTSERWYTFTDAVHGFQFQFPAGWTMTQSQCDDQHPHYLQLRATDTTGENVTLTIGVRLDSEDVYLMRTGVGSGEIVQQGAVQFLGQEVTRDVLIEDGKTQSVLYGNAMEITRGSLVVTLSLDHLEYRKDADLSSEIQAAADQIVQSFAFAPVSNSTYEFELYFYRPLVVDYDPAIWEDRSEPDNKEMMVNSLQHRELASCTIGVRGPSGFGGTGSMTAVTLGEISYTVNEMELENGIIVRDYFFNSAPTNVFDEVFNTIGIPTLQAQYEPSEAKDCIAVAEEVIATLHPSERLINMSFCEKLARDYRTPPNYITYCDPDYNFAFDYPEDWWFEMLAGVPDSAALEFVRRVQRFQKPDMSNYIIVDTYRLPETSTLEDVFKANTFYPDREFPEHEYEDLRIGGKRAYAIVRRWVQDISAVYLFFQHGEYYSIMEIKAITTPKLDTNWQIARSIQIPGATLDDNFFPDELLIDSYQLVR